MTEALTAMILAPMQNYELYKTVRVILIVAIVLCAIAAIVCVCMQDASSSGIDAISGSSETFYSKNKGRSKESVLRLITVICLICIAVLSISFYLIGLLA